MPHIVIQKSLCIESGNKTFRSRRTSCSGGTDVEEVLVGSGGGSRIELFNCRGQNLKI